MGGIEANTVALTAFEALHLHLPLVELAKPRAEDEAKGYESIATECCKTNCPRIVYRRQILVPQ